VQWCCRAVVAVCHIGAGCGLDRRPGGHYSRYPGHAPQGPSCRAQLIRLTGLATSSRPAKRRSGSFCNYARCNRRQELPTACPQLRVSTEATACRRLVARDPRPRRLARHPQSGEERTNGSRVPVSYCARQRYLGAGGSRTGCAFRR
jgi:hypothetical protein